MIFNFLNSITPTHKKQEAVNNIDFVWHDSWLDFSSGFFLNRKEITDDSEKMNSCNHNVISGLKITRRELRS